jgi:diguanylate cyclase (GGDEF)-like protein
MSDCCVRLLLIEGAAGSVPLMRLALRELGPGFELTSVGGLTPALALLAGGRFDVVLLDPALPEAPGPEAVRRLREGAPDVPLLLLASAADVGLCLRAMEQGAHDYLFRDVLTTHLLTRTIREAVERHRPAGPSEADLIDPLTALANQDGLLAQAARLWRSPTRLRKGATLLCLAVEDLTHINATAGPSAGNRALVETAEVLRETFRGADLRCRLGGPEFAILAVGAPEPTAPILLARLEEAVQARNAEGDRVFQLALSVGLAHFDPDRPCSFDDMLQAARDHLGEERRNRRRPSPTFA